MLELQTLAGAWLIDAAFAERMRTVLLPRVAGSQIVMPPQFQPRMAIATRDAEGNFDFEGSALKDALRRGGKTGVAVLDLQGSMSRYGFCGSGGNEGLISLINRANLENDVKALVLKTDTPGGTADSTQELADAIRSSKKPIVQYISSMSCSGGVFVGSQTDHIVMSSETTAMTGSIGVLQVLVNASKHYEQEGFAVEIMRASKSVDKARVNDIEPLTDELRTEMQAELNAIMQVFEGYVKRGRAGKIASDEVFSGKTYRSKEAVRVGLVDELGDLNRAIQIARKL